jgi:hypothetical protein
VSNKSRSGSDVLGVTSPPRVLDRADDVAAYLDASGHATEQIDCLGFYRYQLGDRLAPLCDDDRPRYCATSSIKRRQLALNSAAATYLLSIIL